MSKAQDERCVKCLRSMDAAIKRAIAIRIWKEVQAGTDLKTALLRLSPGTVL